ncbi:MAG: enzyme of heme biosynthesis [Rikenellaceae bacterium]|jgi:tetratricopeptide (TPR) repeat protein|nr:enzyme of heme biosynthesis [Rikenellaceae bacterium]
MKFILKLVGVAAFLLGAGLHSVNAQSHLEDPRYGATPEERTENLKLLNFLRDEINNKNYAGAAEYLKEIMNTAPAASSNIYIWGATIYKNKAARAKSVEEKKIYVDSVMLVYDRRAQYYGDDARRGRDYIKQLKARDYLSLNPLDREGVRRLYKEAVQEGGATTSPAFVVEYLQQLVNDFKGYDIEADALLGEYELLSPLMANASEEDKNNFEALFAGSGAASCENLEALYVKELAEKPGDVDVLRKAFNLMTATGCESDFYLNVAEQYYALEPSSQVAIRLASVFENKQDYSSALKYLDEMIETETDPAAKSDLYVRVAASQLGAGRSAAAAAAARQAISLDPSSGFGHLFLAEAYIAGSSGCSGFHANTVFWLAYDELARARSAFASAGDDKQTRTVDQRMANCRANFPTFEEGFMYVEGYEDGKSYTVDCGWIKGTTTIRSR